MGRTSETARKPQATPASGRQRAATAGTDVQRERILRVAETLFAAQGYAQTTIDQIVRAMGVTKPFVYYYFKDKQEIFETLSWRPSVECFTALDFAEHDDRCAKEKVREGLRRLIRATITNHPAAFFPYREPQVYRAEYLAAVKRLANHFYDRLVPLLEQARRDGDLDFRDAKLAALAACSLPGFLYSWYRTDGRLSQEEITDELTELAMRLLGVSVRADPAAGPSLPQASAP